MSTVNRDETNQNVPVEQVMTNIHELKPGDIGFGKLFCQPPFIEALTHPSMATVNIYRDPRDLAVSIIRYATDIHMGHSLHNHFTTVLKTDEERLKFVIQGSNGSDISRTSLRDRYLKYIGWLDQPVLSIRFEDLINDRRNTLGRILDFIAEKGYTPSIPREESIDILEKAIQPKKSGTFRKGQPGEWRTVFSPATKTLFKDTMGDVLLQLGYESGSDW
jgi:sulfotransferase 6B1